MKCIKFKTEICIEQYCGFPPSQDGVTILGGVNSTAV
jgi:hypothetical protein